MIYYILCWIVSEIVVVVCFQENEMKKIANLTTQFDNKVKEIVEGIATGVQMFKDLIGGRISIKNIVNEFIDALHQLPVKVNIFLTNIVPMEFHFYLFDK